MTFNTLTYFFVKTYSNKYINKKRFPEQKISINIHPYRFRDIRTAYSLECPKGLGHSKLACSVDLIKPS